MKMVKSLLLFEGAGLGIEGNGGVSGEGWNIHCGSAPSKPVKG